MTSTSRGIEYSTIYVKRFQALFNFWSRIFRFIIANVIFKKCLIMESSVTKAVNGNKKQMHLLQNRTIISYMGKRVPTSTHGFAYLIW